MCPYIYLGGIHIKTFSVFLFFAIISGLLFFLISPKYDVFYYKEIKVSMLYASIFAILFGRIVSYVTLIHQGISYKDAFFSGGFVFYGGLIGAILGVIVFGKVHRCSFLSFLDVFASILPMGQAIGRIGCFFNGCCYGIEYGGFMAIQYPILGEKVMVFPTWFVESFFCIVLFLLFILVPIPNYQGYYFSLYLIGYSSFRFLIEFYRGDMVRGTWGNYSTSQIISVILLVCGIFLLIRSIDRKENNNIIKGE